MELTLDTMQNVRNSSIVLNIDFKKMKVLFLSATLEAKTLKTCL